MGLFGKKAADTKEKEVVSVSKPQTPTLRADHYTQGAIVRPRITEKAALLIDRNVYTFEIKKGATKHDVRDAVKALYNVTPVNVRIVNKTPRHAMSTTRGRRVMSHGLRKAYVYLKKGDRIDLV